MAVAGPSRCPDCRYSLKGLPRRHCCPECGFEYDEHTLIWRPKSPRAVYGLAGVIALGVIPTGRYALTSLLNGRSVRSDQILALAACVAASAWMLARAWSSNRRGRYVALTPKGVSVRTAFETALIPWSDVAGLSMGHGAPAVRRRGTGKAVELSHIFSGVLEVANFEIELGRAVVRYGGELRCADKGSVDARGAVAEQANTEDGPA